MDQRPDTVPVGYIDTNRGDVAPPSPSKKRRKENITSAGRRIIYI